MRGAAHLVARKAGRGVVFAWHNPLSGEVAAAADRWASTVADAAINRWRP